MVSNPPSPPLPPIKLSAPATRQFWEIPILYEDAELLCLNKPAGLAIARDPAQPAQSVLMALLHQAIAAGKPWAAARHLTFLMYAHRLDSEASGTLLLVKSKPLLSKLLDAFGSHRARLSFVALASGSPREERFSVQAKLAPDRSKPGLMRIDTRAGKSARTSFEVIERFRRWTLLRAVVLANRPHQLRVHLARARLRLAGDATYGGKPLWLSRLKPDFRLKPNHTERPLIAQASLHAEQLAVPHPGTGQELLIQAPWPKELTVALKYLRKYDCP